MDETSALDEIKVASYIVGAMTPCMKLFSFLDKVLRDVLKSNGVLRYNLYNVWIERFASESFETLALKTEDLLDKLSHSLTIDVIKFIETLYGRSMELQRNFFAALLIYKPTVVPLLDPDGHTFSIFSDFDLTCTLNDSSDILIDIAVQTSSNSNQNVSECSLARVSSSDMWNIFSSISAKFTEDYEQCIQRILLNEKAKEYRYELIYKALEQIHEIEKDRNTRVIESGLLRDVNQEGIKQADKRPHLQDGCIEFFRKIVQSERLNVDVHIISDCWCVDLIRSAFSSGGINDLDIHANNLACEESTGKILRGVESAIEKVGIFKEISEKQRGKANHLSVYIGDSVGDLLCLLEADVGIVFGSNDTLRTLSSHFGVYFVPLFYGLVMQQIEVNLTGSSNWKAFPGTLYTVSSWAEIHASFFKAELLSSN